MRINVIEYDPQWLQTFATLKSHIAAHLGDVVFTIEHVGSTSVPGLAAKPVIDMDIVVENNAVSLRVIQALAKIGYVHLGDQGVPGREAFKRPENSPKHNLYVCLRDSVAFRNHILLRDALRTNSETMSAYAKLKLDLAEKFAGNIDGYCEAKTEFILNILKQQGLSESQLAEVAGANLETWQPLSIDEVEVLFRDAKKDYWISGGWAIDLFIGRQTRRHDDIDISISRSDQIYFQEILKDWDLRASDPPGAGLLRSWKSKELLMKPVYNIWCRKKNPGSWNLELMLCDFESDQWIYRRNNQIRGPLSEFTWTNSEGLKVISPVIQLLYKSRGSRDKDLQDLKNCLKVFSVQQKERLRSLLLSDSGANHPWLSLF